MTMAMEQNQKSEKAPNARLLILSIAFIVGLGAATLLNMLGYTGWAMGFGMIGICCMAMFILNLKTSQ